MATSPLQHQVLLHRRFREQLLEAFPDSDAETLADTLEGLTELSDQLAAVLRSALEDEAFVAALKMRLGEMRERAARLSVRAEKKRQLVSETMAQAELPRLVLPDMTVSLRPGTSKLLVTAEGEIPEAFWTPGAPKLDRQRLTAALRAGKTIPGAVLSNPQPGIAVRTR